MLSESLLTQETGLSLNRSLPHVVPALGKADHNLVLLKPHYTPRVRRLPTTTRSFRKWSPEAEQALKDCFETTDWEALQGSHNGNMEEMVDCTTDYINFCMDTVVPVRSVRCFANNKPWITSDIKGLLNQKKKAFKDGDTQELKQIQKELRVQLREGEGAVQKENRTKDAEQQHEGCCSGLWRAEEAAPQQSCRSRWSITATSEGLCEGAGTPPPAHIQPELGTGEGSPSCWKTSCIIPVPKKPHPGELNDFRPVALTSHVMKTMERLLLHHLRPQTHHALDPLQFAYREKTGVEDAIIFLLHRSLSHLDRGSGAVRITFFGLLQRL
ncbi:hypothetical protein L3Q82_018261 [Scortum barcoo]|uniref:Uncharacterized protein n=1 Tax=Scortum barcoo TaxID=214431 RepID=A0ACB8VIX1_9TELE|nr:hypothetical protein L3Q82_018261 [Scortum barcoo]